MNTKSWIILAVAFSANVLAQEAVTPPVASPPTSTPAEATPAPKLKPTEPLSSAILDRISRMASLFDGKSLDGWIQFPAESWTVKDGAMASLGAGRGVIYTKGDYDHFRLIFTIRHVSGQPDHQACFLVFCSRPPSETEKGLDALGGIQFQPPNGGTWDYRSGKNNGGKGLFTKVPHEKFDAHEWSQVEILVKPDGTARMAVAQPPGTKGIEVLSFNDPAAAKKGPIAWQMHNKGLFDEYKDVRIEENPVDDKLIIVE